MAKTERMRGCRTLSTMELPLMHGVSQAPRFRILLEMLQPVERTNCLGIFTKTLAFRWRQPDVGIFGGFARGVTRGQMSVASVLLPESWCFAASVAVSSPDRTTLVSRPAPVE